MPNRLLYIIAATASILAAASHADVTETAAPAGEAPGVNARLESLELAAKSESQRLHIEGYTQLRYDDQQYKIGSISAPNGGKDIVGSAGTVSNNVRGGYIKKFEVKASGEVAKNFNWVAGVDFAEGKIKDLGTTWTKLPLVPFAFENYSWTMKVGQFRQPFGIEPQTAQANVAFNERSLINGGASPLSPSAGTLQLIGERVLGLQAWQRHDYGKYGYEAGMSLSNDGTDQVKGSNTLGLAFPSQLTDENPTFTTRFGLFCSVLGEHKVGISYQHNSKDTAFMASNPAQQIADESLGVDWRGEIGKLAFLQAEWIGQNTAINGATGLGSRREGWYAQAGFNLLRLAWPSVGTDKLEFLGRYERVNNNVYAVGYSPTISAATVGVKWTYGKNSQTAFNYSAYGIDDNFGAAGNVNLLSLQDLITF